MTNGKKLVISFTLSHGRESDSYTLVLVGYCEAVAAAAAAAVVIIPNFTLRTRQGCRVKHHCVGALSANL